MRRADRFFRFTVEGGAVSPDVCAPGAHARSCNRLSGKYSTIGHALHSATGWSTPYFRYADSNPVGGRRSRPETTTLR